MVVGSILTAAVLTVSNPVDAQVQIPVPASVYNLSQSLSRLFNPMTADDTRKHHGAVLTAVSTLDNGEHIRWYSDDSYNHGVVEIIATAQLSGKLCRRVYTTVVTSRSRDTQEFWGCHNGDGSWEFFKSRH